MIALSSEFGFNIMAGRNCSFPGISTGTLCLAQAGPACCARHEFTPVVYLKLTISLFSSIFLKLFRRGPEMLLEKVHLKTLVLPVRSATFNFRSAFSSVC